MEYLQEITLELNSNTAYTTVGAKQGDSGSRVIKIHITQNGEDWPIPSAGVAVSYRVRKPDGYAIWNNAIIPDPNPENVLYITLTEQTLAAAGRAYADILFTTGTASERQVLSTVSFIIIIMAAPDIVENIASSNEFARILDLTDNADVTLNEAEAWAVGTKSGIPVAEDDFSYTIQGGSFICTINADTFRNEVGRSPGYTRYFMLICAYDDNLADNIWDLQYDDGTVLHNIDLNTYGVTIASGTPLPTNSIRVIVTDKDIQFENNAKYYADQAQTHESFIRNLTVSADTLETGEAATVSKELVGDHWNFNFGLPKGDTGDVYFMTFDVDDNGFLQMKKPDHMSPQISFLELKYTDGYLKYQIDY